MLDADRPRPRDGGLPWPVAGTRAISTTILTRSILTGRGGLGNHDKPGENVMVWWFVLALVVALLGAALWFDYTRRRSAKTMLRCSLG